MNKILIYLVKISYIDWKANVFSTKLKQQLFFNEVYKLGQVL